MIVCILLSVAYLPMASNREYDIIFVEDTIYIRKYIRLPKNRKSVLFALIIGFISVLLITASSFTVLKNIFIKFRAHIFTVQSGTSGNKRCLGKGKTDKAG